MKLTRPSPPKISDEFARKAKRAIFPSLNWREGRGGLNFSFDLSKFVANVSGNIQCTLHDEISQNVICFNIEMAWIREMFLRDFGDCLGGKSYPGDMTHHEESN